MRGALIGQEMGHVKLSVCVCEKESTLKGQSCIFDSIVFIQIAWQTSGEFLMFDTNRCCFVHVVGPCFVNPDIHFNNKWLQSFTQRWNSCGCCYLSKRRFDVSIFTYKKEDWNGASHSANAMVAELTDMKDCRVVLRCDDVCDGGSSARLGQCEHRPMGFWGGGTPCFGMTAWNDWPAAGVPVLDTRLWQYYCDCSNRH